jgi:ABC-type microcin C transport system permease subunit YejE
MGHLPKHPILSNVMRAFWVSSENQRFERTKKKMNVRKMVFFTRKTLPNIFVVSNTFTAFHV